MREGSALVAATLAVGVALAGWFVGNGFVRGTGARAKSPAATSSPAP